MSVAMGVKIERSTPGFDRLRAELMRDGSRPLMAARGKRIERELRAHFLKKDQTPNKKGWRRSHFWNRRIRANTALSEIGADYAVVDIAAPEMAQKLFGGTITPKEAKYLAIPAHSEAAGRSPRLFDDLAFVPLQRGDLAGMLVQKSTRVPYYFLVKKVTQNPDPTALPTNEALEAADADETQRFIERRAARA